MVRYSVYISIICCIAIVLASVPQVDAFVAITKLHKFIGGTHIDHQLQPTTRAATIASRFLTIRGGTEEIVKPKTITSDRKSSSTTALSSAIPSIIPMPPINAWLINTLKGGPLGVIALTLISSAVCVPITQYKNLYGLSVGYGLSVAVISAIFRNTFALPPWSVNDVLSGAALFYGLRLAAFLFIRDVSGAKSLDDTKNSARLQRIPFALSLALFYAFMMTPMLYLMRNPVVASSTLTWKSYVAWTGCGLAWFGAIAEAIADAHKYIVKGRSNSSAVAFRGPTHGLYGITRHPNYTGEVLFWIGIFVSGLPAFGNSIIAWLCSTAGLYGIVTIMRGATKSLEKKQEEKYGGQPKYEHWKKDVPVTLLPLL
jgi:steroid 5-alpha reductase family enzyme